MMIQLWRVQTPRFCAGVCVRDGFIIKCAPILRNWCGKSIEELIEWCNKGGYSIESVLAERI